MAFESESLILQMLREMRADIGGVRGEVANLRSQMMSKEDLREQGAELHAEMANLGAQMATKDDLHSLRADVASDIHVTRKELGEQIVGLRRAVIEYHTSVIGHGVLISELEARVRRIEQHLELPATDAH